MIPTWLQRQLEQTGRWNTDSIGRSITTGRCRHCQQTVIRGLDADIAGIPTTCDSQPTDQLGEALALLTGRQTYDLTRTGGRWQITHRNPWRIRANRRPGAVVAQHACHSPPLPAGPPLTDPTSRTYTQEPTW